MAASPAAREPAMSPTRDPLTRTKALVILNRKARHGRTGAAGALDRLRAAGFELIEEPVGQPT